MSPDTATEARVENVIIVGSGPAGYTAALYTARADLQPLVIEGFFWGGLLQQTTEVENFPGFPGGGIEGPALMTNMRAQAEEFGARFETDEATELKLSEEPGGVHEVHVGDEVHLARTVILAMGAEHKKLGVPGEEELAGRGVSYCATCDAAFFKDKPTVIVGGGDSAMEEAIFLAKFSSKVARGAPARRVPCLGDHAGPGARGPEPRVPDPVRGRRLRGGAAAADRPSTQHGRRQREDDRDQRRLHRDRAHAAVGDRRRTGRHGR